MKFDRKASLPRSLVAILCTIILVPGDTLTYASQSAAPAPPNGQTIKLSAEQLDSLVAPIALYPDPLLAQILAASTYPLEIVEVDQWMRQNGNLHGTQLMDAAR